MPLPSEFEFDPEKSLEEQIEELGQQLMATAFTYMKEMMKGRKIPGEKLIAQEDMNKQFKFIQKTHADLVKTKKATGGVQDEKKFNQSLLQKIKETQSSLGPIVGEIPRN